MRRGRKVLPSIVMTFLILGGLVVSYCHAETDAPSTCFGSTKAGALQNGWRLPASGKNFAAYSLMGWGLGRTYLHSTVHAVVLDAYASLHQKSPDLQFLYGETGLVRGGHFPPHRTHQNGLSVDFMMPVLTVDGQPATLPSSPTNKFGYGVDFDASGKNPDFAIDFDALAMHLAELRTAAAKHKVGIARVILAPDLQPHLRKTASWPAISGLSFSKRKSWVRHDDHYHVDFKVKCEPLSQAP